MTFPWSGSPFTENANDRASRDDEERYDRHAPVHALPAPITSAASTAQTGSRRFQWRNDAHASTVQRRGQHVVAKSIGHTRWANAAVPVADETAESLTARATGGLRMRAAVGIRGAVAATSGGSPSAAQRTAWRAATEQRTGSRAPPATPEVLGSRSPASATPPRTIVPEPPLSPSGRRT